MCTCCGPSRRSKQPRSGARRCGPTAAPNTGRSTSSATSTAATPSLSTCSRSSGTWSADDGVTVTPPDGRRAVFVGDYGDRGPDTPGVLRLVMAMADSRDGDLPARQPRRQARPQAQGPRRADHPRPGRDPGAARRRARRVPRPGPRLPRSAGQPCRPRRRRARRGARRDEAGLSGPVLAARARLRAVRRDDRGDRRVRAAGPGSVGARLPRSRGRRLRPHPGGRARVDQQHDQHRHRMRVRRAAHGAALARARTRVSCPRSETYYEPVRTASRRPSRRSRTVPRSCSTSTTSPASGSSRPS